MSWVGRRFVWTSEEKNSTLTKNKTIMAFSQRRIAKSTKTQMNESPRLSLFVLFFHLSTPSASYLGFSKSQNCHIISFSIFKNRYFPLLLACVCIFKAKIDIVSNINFVHLVGDK